MAKKTQVGEIVTVHRMDSDPLKAGLKQDEALIRASATKMQSSMNGMGGAMKNVNMQAVSTQQTFGVLGAQVGAMGGAFGSAMSPVMGFAGALSGIGKAAFGLPGLILAGAAAIGVLVNMFTKQATAAKEAREEMEAYTKTLRDEAAAADKAFATMSGQARMNIAGAAGPGAVLRETQLQAEAALVEKSNEAYRRRNELIEQARVLEHETAPTLRSEEQLAEIKDRIDQTRKAEEVIVLLIEQSREKLNADLTKLTEDRLAKEVAAEKRANDERARQLAASPMGRVMGAIQGEIKAAMEQQQMSAIFGRMKGMLPEGLRKSIESKLGIGTPEAAEVPGGPAGRVAFAAGGFTDIAGAGGQLGGGIQDIERRKERRDEERNVSLKELLATLKYIASSKRKEVLT